MTDLQRPPGAEMPGGLARVRALAERWVDSALDLVFPPRCVHCQRAGGLLCSSCSALIQPAPTVIEHNPLDGRAATAIFDGPIQSAIHAFKYDNNRRMGILLAQRLADTLGHNDSWMPSLITAIPLHSERQSERGYNQSALLAERLATHCGKPFVPAAVARSRNTRPQVGLSAAERQTNVDGAFQATPALVQQHSILIIDDVYTTGATMRACAHALRVAGAQAIWALTVASAAYHDDPNPSTRRKP